MNRKRQRQLHDFAERLRLTPDDSQYLSGLLAGVIADERRRCARIARQEGRLLCPDTDSIQYRVAEHIAQQIQIAD